MSPRRKPPAAPSSRSPLHHPESPFPPALPWPAWADPLLVGLTAVALRLAWFLEYRQSPFFDFIHLDPEYYVTWARGIAGGSWLGSEVFEQAPLYAYLLAGYMKIFGEGLEALRLIQFGVGAATAVMTGLLARRLLGRSAGLAAGLLAAIYGPFLFFEGQVMKEFLTPFFSVLVLLLFDRAVRGPGARRTWLLAAAGAAIGVAALVRDNILLVLPCLALCLPWMERADGDAAPPARPLRGAILLASGCLAVLLPVAARNYALSGDLVMTTSGGGEVFYIGNGPYANGAYIVPPWVRSSPRFEHEDFRKKARELAGRELTRAEASRFWWREGLRAILADPLRWVRLEARKGLLFINDHELPDNYSYGSFVRFSKILGFLPTFGLMAGLAAAGAVASAGLWRRLLPLYLAGGSYMISVMLFFNFGRFRLPFLPIVFVFAGGGLVALGRAALRAAHPAPGARRAIGGRAVAALAAGALVYLAALPDLHSSAEEPFQDRLHLGAAYRRAGMLDEAEEILRATIEDARGVLADRGWQPGSTIFPVGLSFAWSLHAAHRDLAGVLLDRGRSTEAIEEMRAAIPLDPNDAGLYQMLGGALLGEGESAAAERALRSAVRLRPDSFTARFDLATAIFEQGRAGEALAGLEEARRRSPGLEGLDLADWHYGMGTILFSIPGREGEAVAHFREALDLNPSHHQAGDARAIVSGER